MSLCRIGRTDLARCTHAVTPEHCLGVGLSQMSRLALEFRTGGLLPGRGGFRLGRSPLRSTSNGAHAHPGADQHGNTTTRRVQHRRVRGVRDSGTEDGAKRIGLERHVGHRRTGVLSVVPLAVHKPPRLIDVDDDVVDLRMLRAPAHDVRDDLLRLTEGPVIDRVVDTVERPGRIDVCREICGQRHQRHAGGVGDVGNQLGLAAGIREQDRAQPTGAARRPEHLELLEPIAVVIHADRTVGTAQRIERLVGTHDRTGVCHRVARSNLRAANLEDHDGLARVGGALQRRTKRSGTSNCLEKQADRARALVVNVEGKPIRRIAAGLRPDRDDTTKADTRTQSEDRFADRARPHDGCDTTIAEARTDRAHPWRWPLGNGDAHAVNADAHGVGGDQPLADGGAGDVALFPCGLGTQARNREDAVAGSKSFVERGHDRAWTESDRDDVGLERHVRDIRYAAVPCSLLALRMHTYDLAAVCAEVLQERVARSAIGGADDRGAANIKQRCEVGAQGVGHRVSKRASRCWERAMSASERTRTPGARRY